MEDKTLTRIKELCDKRGWSVYKLAKESEISYSTLNNLFNRNNTPSLPTLERICEDGFGITLSQFFADDKPPPLLSERQNTLLQRFSELSPTNKVLLETFLTGLESKKS
jgi:transcriptional regulator with XRE-family HTH domain